MKFLLDVNMPPSLGLQLESLGHSYRWVPACMEPPSSDSAILQEATRNDEVVLTHDNDFGTLLSFTGSTKPSVIIFRIHKISTERFFTIMTANWSSIEPALTRGALIIIEEDKMRIRDLPYSSINKRE